MKKSNAAIRLLVLFTLGATAISHANITFTFESANGGTQTTFATSGGSVNVGGADQSPNGFGGASIFTIDGTGISPSFGFVAGPSISPGDSRNDILTVSSGSVGDIISSTGFINENPAGIPFPSAGAEAVEFYTAGLYTSSTSGAGVPTSFTYDAFSTVMDISFSEFGAIGNSVTFMTEGAGTGFGNEITFEIIPEPSTVSLIGLCGLAGVMVKRYRTRTSKKDVIPSEGMLEKW